VRYLSEARKRIARPMVYDSRGSCKLENNDFMTAWIMCPGSERGQNRCFLYSDGIVGRQTSKISKPAISSTPMKYCRLFLVSSVLFTRMTSQPNMRA